MQGYTVLLKIILFVMLIWLLVRPGFKGDREWLLIEYSNYMKAFMMAILGFSLLLIYSAAQADKGPITAVFVALFLLVGISIIGVFEAFRCKLWFDNEKIYYQSPYGRRTTINIEDIVQCKLAWFGNTYRIISNQGKKIEITPYMSGASEFYDLVRSYLATKNT